MEKTLFKDRYKKGLNSYTFKELEETIKEFKKEYPSGINFKVVINECSSEPCFEFLCESPETKEEKQKRELKSIKKEKYQQYLKLKAEKEKYQQYLKLKAEFEGEKND